MRDPRLQIDISTEKWHRGRASRRAELAGSHSPQEWHRLIEPLLKVVVLISEGRKVVERPPVPSELAPALRIGWPAAIAILLEHDGSNGVDDAQIAIDLLLSKIGEELARHFEGSPDRWLPLVRNVRTWAVLEAFCGALPTKAVEGAIDTLLAPVIEHTTLKSIRTLGHWRDVEETRLSEWLAERESAAGDPWAFAVEVERAADEMSLNHELRWIGRLVLRGGAAMWCRWLLALPSVVVAAVAITDVDNLDFAQETLSLAVRAISTDIRVVLLLRHIIDLWQQVERNLTRASSSWTGSDIDKDARTVYTAQLRDWSDNELVARAREVARIMVTEEGAGLTKLTLRNLLVQRWRQDVDPTNIGRVLRSAIVESLVARGSIARSVENLLVPMPKQAAMLSAAALVFQSGAAPAEDRSSAADRVVDGYLCWLQSDEMHWSQPLIDDDHDLAWNVAGLVAMQDDPVSEWRRLDESQPCSTEGWGVSVQDRSNRPKARAHVLVVGAMATEWLAQNGRTDDAVRLFEIVWERLHLWTRSLAGRFAVDEASTPLVHTWARLVPVLGERAPALALRQLPLLDRLDWLLTCAVTFRGNYIRANAGRELPIELQQEVDRLFTLMYPVWERRHGIGAEMRDSYRKHLAELTPEIGEAAK